LPLLAVRLGLEWQLLALLLRTSLLSADEINPCKDRRAPDFTGALLLLNLN
jgi:hypothetical protein